MDNGIPMVAIETDRTPSIKRQDSFEMKLPDLPKVDVHPIQRQSSKNSEPDSPISPLLTSDPKNERSHSQTFSRPQSERDDTSSEQSELDEVQHQKPPSFWRLATLSIAEWPYALLGTIGAAIFGSFNPLLAYTIALIVSAYYQIEIRDMRHEVNRWCLFIVGMGVITVLVNWLQHFYFGIMGEKMTERIRRMMFSGNCNLHLYMLFLYSANRVVSFTLLECNSYFMISLTAMLRNEVGWFDKEENNADTLSMRLANDATFVRAAFSNRLSIFIQDTAAVSVALLIGMLLGWRVALVALATLPVLVISAIAQVIKISLFVCYIPLKDWYVNRNLMPSIYFEACTCKIE
jgi:ATP-binding cassette subfamily B (MDR/TAP) protein 1